MRVGDLFIVSSRGCLFPGCMLQKVSVKGFRERNHIMASCSSIIYFIPDVGLYLSYRPSAVETCIISSRFQNCIGNRYYVGNYMSDADDNVMCFSP